MSAADIAADQLKCLRALSVILADGALTMPESWHMHTFTSYDPPFAPTLEGLFLDDPRNPPSVTELRELLDVYAERYGLAVEQKPHGETGKVGLHTVGKWQGVEVHVWGPARPDAVAEAVAQRAELHLDLFDEALAELASHAGAGVAQ